MNVSNPVFSKKFRDIWVSSSLFKNGSTPAATKTAKTEALHTINAVSPMNCRASCLRLLPNTFLTPTSFERFTACAVARLMKFTQAITRRKIPISDKAVMRE